MGLFDKKICDVCGEKIGMLGNRKLRTAISARTVRRSFLRGLTTEDTVHWKR